MRAALCLFLFTSAIAFPLFVDGVERAQQEQARSIGLR